MSSDKHFLNKKSYIIDLEQEVLLDHPNENIIYDKKTKKNM
jgi:hypothetical protein